MEEYLEALRLDADTIVRDRDFCADIARAYEATLTQQENGDMRDDTLAVLATNFRRAAAHSLLLDDLSTAQELFVNAARAYERLESPYALIMRSFTAQAPSYRPRLEEQLRRQWEERASRYFPFQSIYILLVYSIGRYEGTTEFADPEYMRNIWEDLEAYRAHPVGILGLPLGSYLDLIGYFDEGLSRRGFSIEESLLPFINGYNTAVRQAIQDRYHWRRLALPFHPAEPDIFGVLLLVQSALIRKEQSLIEVVRTFPLASESRRLLNGILRSYS